MNRLCSSVFPLILVLAACATAGGSDGDDPDAAASRDAPTAGTDAAADAPTGIDNFLLSEFVFNHLSDDSSEFIEVIGPASSDASEHSVIVIEGDIGAGAGTLYFVEALGTTNTSGFEVTAFFSNGLQNGTQTLLLVTGLTGSAGTDLDTNDDGTLDVEPWLAIVDGVAVTDGDAGDLVYTQAVLPPDFDGGFLPVGGASRVPNGTDTDAASDWTRNDFDGEGLPCCGAATADSGEAINTPASANQIKP